MSDYRFILEPYKGSNTRHTCPACERPRCFARYIDTEGRIQFPNHVGRCDHEHSCSYHYTPKEYFADNPEEKKELFNSDSYHLTKSTKVITPPSYIERDLMEQSLQSYQQNNLYIFLAHQLGTERAMNLMRLYHIGTSKHWDGATIFWQIDTHNQIRTGKIMLYNSKTGKRVKTPFNHVTWVHSLLRIPHFNLRQCFFGEHLLSKEKQKPIAIVESEKTALIASFYLPQYLWIATGGKNGCFRAETLTPLMKRQIVLFPDLGATDYWQEKMTMMRKIGFEVRLFDYLEKTASAKDLKAGYDIADYLLQIGSKIELINNLTLTKEVENLYQKGRKESHEAKPTPRKRGFKL